jgi:SpoVK/Ycf46/Vps4 family AAA+-type ATPase
MSRHLIFVGNPGTGKTTVARLVGGIYKALGLLPTGQLVEVDRSELVAGYVGQTAMKTAEVCAKAVGGVLFIDEAYSLTGDQFAQEAVNTLVKEMEDHREDLVVIVAGYPEPMVHFIAQNPGLASRFTTTIEFDDYSDDELLAILDSIADMSDYELTDEARRKVRHTLEATARTPAFGNGRFVRNLFEHAMGRHAWRLQDAVEPTLDDLRLLREEDVVEQPDDEQDEKQDDDRDDPQDDPQDDQEQVRDDPDGAPETVGARSEDDLTTDEEPT